MTDWRAGRPDVRVSSEVDSAWHRAVNEYEAPYEGQKRDAWGPPVDPAKDGKRFMYEAKKLAEEVPRLALLFGYEREGKLAARHHQCSRDHEGAPVSDNHLMCCLGVECRKCPHLAAIDTVSERVVAYNRDGPPTTEAIEPRTRDLLKAWTCAAHIVSRGGDVASEGYVLTVDDRMFWNNVYDSLSFGQGGA